MSTSGGRGATTNASSDPSPGVARRRSSHATRNVTPPIERNDSIGADVTRAPSSGSRGGRGAVRRAGAAVLAGARDARCLAAAEHSFVRPQRHFLNLRLRIRLACVALVVHGLVHGVSSTGPF